MDVDDYAWLIKNEDHEGIEGARDHVKRTDLDDLVRLYWRLDTWPEKGLLIQLLQDHWEPHLCEPVMLDVLRAPTSWHNGGHEDTIHWAQAVALGFLDERYDRFGCYWRDRGVLRAAVEEMRRVRGLDADHVADEPAPLPPYSEDPVTRLEQACVRGDTGAVLALLDNGLDVDTPLSIGTPILHALINGRVGTAARLLEHGASVRARWKYTGATVLIKAAAWGDIPLVDAALARGASVDETDDSGLTALYQAADCGHADMVRHLLKAGASPLVPARSAFVAAAGSGHLEVAEVLLAAGCGLEERAFERTALGDAAILNQAEAVDFLIAAGANVDARDGTGRTPLMHAAQHGFPRIVERLLRAGADPSATDNNGKTARDLVRRHRKAEVLALLPPAAGLEIAPEEDWRTVESWWCDRPCYGDVKLLMAVGLRGVPHDTPDHDSIYQDHLLMACTKCWNGRLDSVFHDCSKDKPWYGVWHRKVAPEEVERLREAFRDCPQWKYDRCECPLHKALNDSAAQLGTATTIAVEVVDGVARFAPR